MYCVGRVFITQSQCRPTIKTLLCCVQQLANHAKLPAMLSNQSQNLSSNCKIFYKKENYSSSARNYKLNQAVKLIDSNDQVICETTYVKAKNRALSENMKLFDLGSDPMRKVVKFKYVTGKEYYEMSLAAKKEKKEMKEASDDLKMKIVRLKCNIMDNDLDYKMKAAMEGINKGHPLKVAIRYVKGTGPDEMKMKESELLDKISKKYVGDEGKLTVSKENGILCYIYPNDSEES